MLIKARLAGQGVLANQTASTVLCRVHSTEVMTTWVSDLSKSVGTVNCLGLDDFLKE
jgi:hypothetical protein